MFVTDVNVVTGSRVEVHLFIPDMSVRPLLASCHPVLASFEIREALGSKRLHELLYAFLKNRPSLGRLILVQRAYRARFRPKMLLGHQRERFWKIVGGRDIIAERERYRRTQTAASDGYEADEEEIEDSDPEANCDPSDHDFHYEALGLGYSEEFVYID